MVISKTLAVHRTTNHAGIISPCCCAIATVVAITAGTASLLAVWYLRFTISCRRTVSAPISGIVEKMLEKTAAVSLIAIFLDGITVVFLTLVCKARLGLDSNRTNGQKTHRHKEFHVCQMGTKKKKKSSISCL